MPELCLHLPALQAVFTGASASPLHRLHLFVKYARKFLKLDVKYRLGDKGGETRRVLMQGRVAATGISDNSTSNTHKENMQQGVVAEARARDKIT